MTKAIYFDMDGTFVDLYGVNGWLENLQAFKTRPYREAKPLLNMRTFGKVLNQLQKNGYHIGIISWTSKAKNAEYDAKVVKAKKAWLAKHLGSVHFDEIKVVPYGTPKQNSVDFPFGILFDDEKPNREKWSGTAYDVDNILEILKALA